MPCAADTFIAIELVWLAIGAVVWTLLYYLPHGYGTARMSPASIVIVTTGAIMAWPVALVAAILAYSKRGRA